MSKFLALDLALAAASVAAYIATWHHNVWGMVAALTVCTLIAIAIANAKD